MAAGGYLADYALNLGLTRLLSPHAYGDFKVAFAFAFAFGLVVLLGGDRAAPMVLAPCLERGEPRQAWEYLRFYLGNATVLALGLAVVVWTASYLHVGSTDPRHHHPLAWVVLVVPLNAAAAMISRTLQSARRPALAVFPWRIGLPLLQLTLLGLLVWFRGDLGIEEAIAVGALSALVLTVLQWRWVRRLGLVELAREPDFRQPRRWLGASVPMMGAFLVALALGQSDLYFLEALGDDAEVGHYAAAATAAHVLLLVQTTVVGLIAPLVRPAIDAGPEASRATYRKGQVLLVGVALPVTLLLAVAAGPIIATFGAQYRAAQGVLVLLAVGNFAWAAAALSNLWLQYTGRAAITLAISVSTLVVDSALNLVLIPRYGMTGAAAGTAATLTAGALAVLLARRLGSR